MDAPTDILAFWRLVEWLTPASFPNTKPKRNEHEPVYDIRPHEALPWDNEHPHRQHRCAKGSPGNTSDNPNEGWAYGVYAGLLDINATRIEIESWLGEDPDHVVRDERPPEGTSTIGFQVDGNGRVIAGTLVVSTFAWAYGALRQSFYNDGTKLGSEALVLDVFKEVELEVHERFSSELSGVQLTTANCDRFLEWLFNRLCLPQEMLALRRCRVQCVRRPLRRAGNESAAEQASPRLSRAIEMLNSHFLDDLERVQGAAQQDDYGLGLAQYLGKSPAQHIDLRKEHNEAWELLSPELFPQGRWPGKGRYPLVFSQQLAVNQAFRTLGGREGGMMAVNGPPGTGKTTLLKDVVAGIIVARACVLSEFKTPDKAFDATQPAWQSGSWRQLYAPIDDKLNRFGIVVASSNNGAVENVTLEFPKADDVDAEWGDRTHSPFTQIASAMLGDEQEAWSLLSACLGKSQNRTAFADAVWGWESNSKEDDGHARLPSILKGERPAGVLPWRAAVKAFNQALSDEEACREERQQIYQQATSIWPLEADLVKHRQQLQSLQAELDSVTPQFEALTRKWKVAKKRHDEALHEYKATREADLQLSKAQYDMCKAECESGSSALRGIKASLERHERREPGAFKYLIHDWVRPLDSVREWCAVEQDLAARIAVESANQAALQAKLAEGMQALTTAQKALTPQAQRQAVFAELEACNRLGKERITLAKRHEALSQEVEQLKANQERLETKLLTARAEVDKYAEVFGKEHCPTPNLLIGPAADKELSSPWGDKEWEAARVSVFRAALDLHDAFIYEAGKPLQHNLRGMIKMLRGQAPVDLPAGVAESMWTSLFLVVPVVSTTFASFSNQFATLGRESLGWLMIDEAGQAAPQQAAGAIWRAKSSLVVGDPLQLEPVVTVPDRLQATLAEGCNVSMGWLPSKTSTQSLADNASSHGSRIGETWVGAPLLVHRRCDSPMFEIANEVAYDDAMVHGKPSSDIDLPPSAWIHVESEQADGHWKPAEGEAVTSLIEQLREKGVEPKDIFLISPFRSVVNKLQRIAYRMPGLKAGTIHTVQGKEADVVILVLGGDPAKAGAKAWASSTPNLVNVAVSRAKHRVYVVADRKAWERYPYFQTCSEMLLHLPDHMSQEKHGTTPV